MCSNPPRPVLPVSVQTVQAPHAAGCSTDSSTSAWQRWRVGCASLQSHRRNGLLRFRCSPSAGKQGMMSFLSIVCAQIPPPPPRPLACALVAQCSHEAVCTNFPSSSMLGCCCVCQLSLVAVPQMSRAVCGPFPLSCRLVGGLGTGPVMGRVGRKITLLSVSVIMILGAVIT